MPRLPSLKPKELLRILEKKGYIIDRQKGSHVILYHVKLKKRIVVPMHLRDLPRGTLSTIIKQAGISKEEFIED